MLRLCSTLCALVLCTVTILAQAPTSVSVRLTQPPPNQLRIADLWKVELVNNSRLPVRVFLHGTAEETSIPDGLIADARTRVIVLQPGRTMVTGNDVQPVTVDEADKNYQDALLRTGSMPSGAYTICCEVVSEETDAVLGRDCKFVTVDKQTIPMLVSPPDESEVFDRLPVFTWLPPSPMRTGQRVVYQLRIVEIFGRQTPYDAMRANPAWFEGNDVPRTVFQYPVSTRTYQIGQKYAWKVTAWDKSTARPYSLGESEIWSFTYVKPDNGEIQDTILAINPIRNPITNPGADSGGVQMKQFNLTADIPCTGENWDFETGTLGCWTVEGSAFVDDPVVDAHPVLGQLGQHGKYWVSSYGLVDGDGAVGSMLSEEFAIKNSTISFLAGGPQNSDACVELLVERMPKDTFKFPTRKIAGMTSEFMIVNSTVYGKKGKAAEVTPVGAAPKEKLPDVGGASDKLVPVEWDVLKYLNRNARIYIRDTSKSAHVNADYFRFYDRELDDTIKLPVLVMAAGENHSLSATPEEKVKMSIRDLMAKDMARIKAGDLAVKDLHIIDQTSTDFKVRTGAVAQQQQFTSFVSKNGTPEEEPLAPILTEIKLDDNVMMMQAAMALAALNPKNIVWGWGDNVRRAVGRDFGAVVNEPKKIEQVKDVKALAAGMDQSLAVTKAGDVMAWGFNDYWQLGTNDRDIRTQPTSLGLAQMAKVATGSRHSMALTTKGEVYVWGYNRAGECGSFLTMIWDNTSGQVTKVLHIPKPVKHPGLQGIRSIAAGHSHSVALSYSGNVYCWGVNDNGQCGMDDDDIPAVTWPMQVLVGGKNSRTKCVSVAAGDFHTVALSEDGKVYTWGGNASGQLGDGTVKDNFATVLVQGLPKIRAVGAGATSSFAIDSLGNLWAWGNNALGQLGDGTRVGKYKPVKVSRIDAVVGVVGGGAHTMAVRADGSLWTWGTNEYGQLGEGPVTNLTPVPLDPALGPIRVERLATQ